MLTWKCHLVAAIGVGAATLVSAQTRQNGGPSGSAVTLTDQDRAEIEQLVERYASALSRCAEQEYADLFTPDGVFTTDEFRGEKHRELYGKNGRVVGRAKLMELVHTEDFCLHPDAKQPAQGASGNARRPASVVIEPSADGATGTAPLGNGGRYEDVYVKTAAGWRFRSRTVFMPPARGSQPATSSSR
jgi:SnoaL-like domain